MKKLLLIILGFLILGGITYASGDAENVIGLSDRLKFFGILVPAAIGDSINPCAFAVMFILLSSILREQGNKKTVLFAGALFTLSVFISYMAMGLGLYRALATTSSIFYLKLVVGIIGILVGLANLKDYFWYGKLFKMEVPDSWRPKMWSILKKVVSPGGAFVVGFIVSLFLLPCTSGPYLVVLGYLASETQIINTWGYIYILIYNLIFILPMIAITFIVGTGYKNIADLREYKEANTEILHLITGIIMLLLGIYILFDILV
ncbi:MAG: sulfite exporter TauE/SafE family protein [Candidatus Gracilibacteria bacterium]|nr:sulfite exporter TauE/SafE family protein [Candidatus Gracilibacteria bacterium]